MDGIFTKNNLRTDNIPINFNEAKQIAKDGGMSNIRITEASGAAFVLKEIGNAPSSGIKGDIFFDDADGLTTLQTAEELQQDTSDTANRITEDDSEDLEKGGMSIERYNKERLGRLLETRKVMRELTESAIEGTQEKLESAREAAKEEGKRNAVEKADPKYAYIAERLVEANLPVTESNITRIAEAVKMAGEAQFMTDASFSYLIENRLEPTASNVYKAVHSGNGAKYAIDDGAFEELMPDLKKVADETGLEFTESVQYEAKSLLESEIPVTVETLRERNELGKIQDAFTDGTATRDILAEAAVQAFKDGFAPKDMNLKAVIRREETRLQGTYSAAGRMKSLGVEPDTKALEARLEALKTAEREASGKLLDGLENEEGLKDIYEKMLAGRDSIEKAGDALAPATFSVRRTITFTQLSVQAEGLVRNAAAAGQSVQSAATANAAISYEASATEIRTDLGDSIKKAFAGTDSILTGMNLELTDANRRAVRMLGYNSIEITGENIEEMKYYDSQIETLKNSLKPQVTAELIKRGVNPLEMTVKDLSTVAEGVERELGKTPEERFSEYLVKLERHRDITAEQRESYIGIYRMLYGIEKSDGAAVGALVKSGRELTLRNLLTETRTLKRRNVDYNIDDDFGGVERSTDGLSIDEQVAAAFGTHMLNSLNDNATPGRLLQAERRLEENGRTLADAGADEILAALNEAPEDAADLTYMSQRLDRFRETLNDSEAETAFLKNFGCEDSVANIRAASEILGFTAGFGRLSEISERKGVKAGTLISGNDARTAAANETADILSVTTLPETEKDLSETVQNLSLTAAELMETLYAEADLTGREASVLSNVRNLAELKGTLASRHFYDIPLADEDGILNVHLTMVHDSAEKGSFTVTFKGLRASGSINKDTISIFIAGESRETLDEVKKDPGLAGRLKEAGFERANIAVSSGNRINDGTPGETGTETQKLYAAARETVLFLRKYAKETGDSI